MLTVLPTEESACFLNEYTEMNKNTRIPGFKHFDLSRKIFIRLSVMIMTSVVSSMVLARPAPLVWEKLEFEGSKLLIRLNAEVSREKISAQRASTELIEPGKLTAKQPNGEYVLKTEIKTKVLGNESHFIAWQNPDLEVLQRTTLYSGLKNWYRNYRFLPKEVFSLKINPASGESVDDWQKWTDIDQSVHTYRPSLDSDQNSLKEIPLSESAAIFDILAGNYIEKPGDEYTLHVFNRRGNFAVLLRAAGQQTLQSEFQQSISGNVSKRKNKTTALDIRLEAKPLENKGKASDFKFLGYKDSISIFYDPLLNLPLKLSGDVEYAGKVTIHLKQASFVKSLTINP